MENVKQIEELNLTGNVAENFKRWRQRFDIYMEATGIAKSEEITAERKVAILLHTIGAETLEIYNTLDLKEEERKDYKKVLEKLQLYFIPLSNETVNRHLFNTRFQKDDEPVDSFVTELKKLSKDCNFGELKDSLIRDRIICGISDLKIKDRLLREPNLDLLKCINICKAAEIAEKQTKQIMADELKVQVIKKTEHKGKQEKYKVKQDRERERDKKATRNCTYCGSTHPPRRCPAYKKKCNNCQKYNHFEKMCKFKRMNVVEKDDSDEDKEDTLFVGILDKFVASNKAAVYTINKEWYKDLTVEGKKVRFKLDTGAQVNIMTKAIASNISACIKPTKTRLRNYNGSNINVYGETIVKCTDGEKTYNLKFQVIDFEAPCIIGLPDIETLDVLKKVDKIQIEDNLETLLRKNECLFQGLGELNSIYDIKLKQNYIPVTEAPRKIPINIQDDVKKELAKMEQMKIIRKVSEATEWVSSLVVVRKTDGSLRLCLDPRNLNQAVIREIHQLPTFEELASKMHGARVFSILDANKGFYQVKLSEQSQLLTTFNAGKYGRYCYQRLPFGLSSAPEVFHRTFKELFNELPGVEVYIDDIIIWGDNEKQHNERLKNVFDRLRKANVRLNKTKCKFGVSEVKYLGHILSSDGLKPDKEKINAILEMEEPKNKKELQTILGMVTYINKFLPNLTNVTDSMRQLLRKNSEFVWTENHRRDFLKLKEMLTNTPVLKFYNIEKPVMLSVDSSSYGLGAVLLQDNLPVAYASKALTESQKLWAQIEKELLAIVHGCERFHQYIFGKTVTVETDHKPLVHIFNKSFNDTPLRLQRLRLRLQPYDLVIKYKPGKDLLLADALSRNNIKSSYEFDKLECEIDAHVDMIISNLSFSKDKLNLFKQATQQDTELTTIKNYIENGWPNRDKMPYNLKCYYPIKDELFVIDNLVFKNANVVVPLALRKEMLELIHYNHLGIEKCKSRARNVLYWPYMNNEIENMIRQCATCLKFQKTHQNENLILREVPNAPWQDLGSDIFYFKGKAFLLLVDYYSKFIEFKELNNESTDCVIVALKSNFARYGIPNKLYSDNGPQFQNHKFKEFAKIWKFEHVTSSPYYPKSNGLAERYVQTCKQLLKKADHSGRDPYIALLEYRNTPIDSIINKTPSQLMFGRNLNAFMPTFEMLRNTETFADVKSHLEKRHSTYKYYHDQKNKAKLNDFMTGDTVFIKDKVKDMTPAKVIGKAERPRCYKVQLSNGKQIQRNRFNLYKAPFNATDYDISIETPLQEQKQPVDNKLASSQDSPQISNPTERVNKFGRLIKKPAYLADYI